MIKIERDISNNLTLIIVDLCVGEEILKKILDKGGVLRMSDMKEINKDILEDMSGGLNRVTFTIVLIKCVFINMKSNRHKIETKYKRLLKLIFSHRISSVFISPDKPDYELIYEVENNMFQKVIDKAVTDLSSTIDGFSWQVYKAINLSENYGRS